MEGQILKGHLELLVVATIKRGATHGYAIIQELKDLSGDRFVLAEGTLYPVLHRLERRGILASSWARSGGRKRRIYKLTRLGQRWLAESGAQWKEFSKGVTAVMGSLA